MVHHRDTAWDPAVQSHEEWRRDRILWSQRARRARMRRIDYYPSDAAAAIVDRLVAINGVPISEIIDAALCVGISTSGIK